MKVCTITGHRPSRFKFKMKETQSGCKRLKRRIQEQCELLYAQGIRQFWVGGAQGVDMWAGEILLRMKEHPEYKDLELHIALPGPEHDKLWDERSKLRMNFLIRHSTECVMAGKSLTTEEHPIAGEKLTAENYQRRNHYMVDRSDIVLAVYDNDRSVRSGTGATVHYAQNKKGLPVVLIHPDSGQVSCLNGKEKQQ